MKTLKLEVGKTYRNRKGEEVKIVSKDNAGRLTYQGNNDEWYMESGNWNFLSKGDPEDLIEEVEEAPETRHTFPIPDSVKEITLDYFGNRIVVEMVPEKEPKPGDVMINKKRGSMYIFKSVRKDGKSHKPFVWLGENGSLLTGGWCLPGRPATPEEAQRLWDALKKAGKRWNAESMEVEEIPESTRIREWVEGGYYNHEDVAEVIGRYLKHREGEK